MVDVLVTTRTTRPGVYIGRVNRAAPTGLTGYARLPCYVGKGSRLRTVFNQPIRRSYLSDVLLSFPTVSPHVVALAYPAVNDQIVARLFRSDGVMVPASKWQFVELTPGSGLYDGVLTAPEAFDVNVQYYLDYQSTSRLILDVVPFTDTREVRLVGNTENQDLYDEYVNYYVPITVSLPSANLLNAFSANADNGFSPAEVTASILTPFTYTFPAGTEVFTVVVNGVTFTHTFDIAAGLTTTEVVAIINAITGFSAEAEAIVNTAPGSFTIRSKNFDPAASFVEVSAGTANLILGTQSKPAAVTNTTGSATYAVLIADHFIVDINYSSFEVVFAADATITVAAVVARINAFAGLSVEGLAVVNVDNTFTIRSNDMTSAGTVVIGAGAANVALGFGAVPPLQDGLRFPQKTMALTAGCARPVAGSSGRPATLGVKKIVSTSSHNYNRRYRITLGAKTADIAATIEVLPDSGASLPEIIGSNADFITGTSVFGLAATGTQPQLPIYSTFGTAEALNFVNGVGANTEVVFTDITGDVVTFMLDDTNTVATTTDVYEVTLLAPSKIEIDSATANTKQHASFSAVGSSVIVQDAAPSPNGTTVTGAVAGTGTISTRADAEFVGLSNTRYALVCTVKAGSAGAFTATFVWQSWGEAEYIQTGTFNISEVAGTNLSQDLNDGVLISLDFGASNFTVNDIFWFQANAARAFVTAKDDRDFILEVAAVGQDLTVTTDNMVTFQYQTGTPEGGFGLKSASGSDGKLFFPGVINLRARNIGSQVSVADRFVLGDKWTWSTVCTNVLDWSLTALTTETMDPTQVYTDSLGVITGTVGMFYVVLNAVPTFPDGLLYVRDAVTLELLSGVQHSPTQPYISFVTMPTNAIEIRYETTGAEPAPGALYYVTANTVRSIDLYNTPIRALSYDEASALLGPSATTNDLLIMAQIALDDNAATGAYFCQARDTDGDGLITNVDVAVAVEATEAEHNLTDVVVLSTFGALSAALANNEKMNDPFERGERALWVGTPVGTAIGDENTAGTLTFLARKTLQVYGSNPAHGKRVLVANNEVTKTITLTDGTQVVVTKDGSFLAGAIAALNASFSDPGETLLRKNVYGFDSINTYSEPEQLLLIGAGIIYVNNVGDATSPVFRVEESTTVDRSSDDNSEISVAINQKEYTTRVIRTQMDTGLISIVPPSEQAGVAIIQTFLVEILTGMVANGLIGPYTDDSGNARPLDPEEDVKVFRATDSKASYNFQYWWNARYPVKRLYGLFSVDRKFFGTQA